MTSKTLKLLAANVNVRVVTPLALVLLLVLSGCATCPRHDAAGEHNCRYWIGR
jgi:hypothetical protein